MLLHVSAVHFSVHQVGILVQNNKGEKPLLAISGYTITGKFMIIIPKIKL
jgi:hypothetical protein